MSTHKECGEEIRWVRRDDDPSRWRPPLEFAGQAFIITEEDVAVQVSIYRPHHCDPDKMLAWQEYKERLAEIQSHKALESPTGIPDWQIAKQRREEEVWQEALKRPCPKCKAEKNVKCHKLDHHFKKTGELVECRAPHSERIE